MFRFLLLKSLGVSVFLGGGVGGVKFHSAIPMGSMYGIFTYIWDKFMVDVGKYAVRPMDP